MDALSHTLTSIRLTSPLLALLHIGQNVSIRMIGGGPSPAACPFHYVTSGSLKIVAAEFELLLQKGDLVILPHWPAHCVETGNSQGEISIFDIVANHHQPLWTLQDGLDTSSIMQVGEPPFAATDLGGIFAFDRPHAAALLKDLPPYLCVSGQDRGIDGILNAALGLIMEESQRPGYAATAARLLEVLLIETLRCWTLSTPHGPGRLRGMVDEKLTKVLHMIHSRPGRRWTLQDLAAIAGQSRSNFAANFKTVLGTTPAAYITEWRCQLAESRLRDNEPIAKIALDLGYASSFAFSRAFTSVRGMTPAHFRRTRRV